MAKMKEVLFARKLAVGSVLLVTALVVTYFKNDIPQNLLSFMQALYCFFVVGNGLEYYSNLKTKKEETKNE